MNLQHLSRRDLLRVGTVAVTLGPTSFAAPKKKQAKSVILIFLDGAPSHIDLFDMKPNAPAEVHDRSGRPFAACEGTAIERGFTG